MSARFGAPESQLKLTTIDERLFDDVRHRLSPKLI
jgi:hypothetical protein